MSTSLKNLLRHAAPARPVEVATGNGKEQPAQPPASVPQKVAEAVPTSASQPDPAALLAAARLVLNAVNEVLYASLNANDAHAAAHVAATALQPDPLASSVSLPELLRTFLSDRERVILKTLARVPADQKSPAGWVQLESGITASEFWVIWHELQSRGLIRKTGTGNGRAAGYTFGVDWLTLLLN